MRYSKLDEVAVLTEPSEEILKSDMLGGARLLVSSKEEAMLAGIGAIKDRGQGRTLPRPMRP